MITISIPRLAIVPMALLSSHSISTNHAEPYPFAWVRKREEQTYKADLAEARQKYLQQDANFLGLMSAEHVQYTDNESQEHIILVWDQDHADPLYQIDLENVIREIYQKERVPLIIRETGLGDDSCEDRVEDIEWLLPSVHAEGGIVRELCTPADNYATKLLESNVATDLRYFILKYFVVERCFSDVYDVTCIPEYEREQATFQQERARYHALLQHIAPNTLSDVEYDFRSYASVDALLDTMMKEKKDRAILIYGAAHMLQIMGYLDHLGISYTEVILNANFYVLRRMGIEESEEAPFSLDMVQEYHTINAQRAFDIQEKK